MPGVRDVCDLMHRRGLGLRTENIPGVMQAAKAAKEAMALKRSILAGRGRQWSSDSVW